ncbi:D,D-heptose 1,7-bisphosphate phosphatase [Mucilaginibacter pineti]|uniref:D,D-heptose 1,7-bisphosphate phosphatase n=1 Tax=Mucilaginibacter pineti TaxID=1391627 RepID=A0A1G7H7I6_9SPHI|nr:HAD family hydrolase [Mucilaginibacter pineti]SDE96293.1 D,D-heptose 1,7-bisphosphate phosphatase [Mucilaginibacter pineti]
MNKAVFLDKDGTLIDDIPYNVNPALIALSKNSQTGLKSLLGAGYLLVVISNQSGVARGFFTERALSSVKNKLNELLGKSGIKLSGFYYCPHHPAGINPGYSIDCDCRKPKPGLIQTAAGELNIDLEKSWMIGDILNDVEAGARAGCKTILIDNGNETEWTDGDYRTPNQKVNNINDAAAYILNQQYV